MRKIVMAWSGAFLLAAGNAMAQDTAPSDAQIAAIVVTANQVDVDAGKFAEQKASNNVVKSFARQMVADHSASNKSVNQLASKLKLKPEENATSKSLRTGGDETMSKLKTLSGAEFDKAYIDSEIVFHQKVLDSIDKTLTPNARNEELKALLMKTRPVVASHLEHAKQIQSSTGKKTP